MAETWKSGEHDDDEQAIEHASARPRRSSRASGAPGRTGNSRRSTESGNGPKSSDVKQAGRKEPNSGEDKDDSIQAIDPKKRIIAVICDVISVFALSLVLAAAVSLLAKIIPFLGRVVTQQFIIVALLLLRDYLYQGRGIGKNLMGLQVVDATTGKAPSLLQSVKRNLIFFLPLIVKEILAIVLSFTSTAHLNSLVIDSVNLICMLYVIIVIPAECWTAYSREDSRRFGDRLANTRMIESPMNFSRIT